MGYNKNKISKFALAKGNIFEGGNAVEKFAIVRNSYVGFGTYISSYSKFFDAKIGRFCSIGQNVQVVFGNHPTSRFVSTHPCFYSKNAASPFTFSKRNKYEEYTYIDSEKKFFIEIGNDVWIGYGAILMSGIHIGNGAVVAAGSVVTKDIPSYSIVGGVPARVIKNRFSKDEIIFLEGLRWWDKGIAWVEKYSDYFDDINRLKEELHNE